MIEPSLVRGDGSIVLTDHSNIKGDNNMEELGCMAVYCNGKELIWVDYVIIYLNIFGIPLIIIVALIIALIIYYKGSKKIKKKNEPRTRRSKY